MSVRQLLYRQHLNQKSEGKETLNRTRHRWWANQERNTKYIGITYEEALRDSV